MSINITFTDNNNKTETIRQVDYFEWENGVLRLYRGKDTFIYSNIKKFWNG